MFRIRSMAGVLSSEVLGSEDVFIICFIFAWVAVSRKNKGTLFNLHGLSDVSAAGDYHDRNDGQFSFHKERIQY